MPRRRCLDCGQITTTGSRCTACKTHHKAKRNAAAPIAAALVEAWRQEHGDWCPGWNRPAHPATDLTGDHTIPLARGGTPHHVTGVLCRSCNSRKGAR